MVITVPASSDVVDDVSLDPLDTPYASPLCSLPSPFPEYHNMLHGDVFDCIESLGIFRGYNPSLNPYSLYLESMPLKIMLITAFNFFTDFSKAFDKFKRALMIILHSSLSASTYIDLSCMLRCLISSCEL